MTSEFGVLRLSHRFDEVPELAVTPGSMAAVFRALEDESAAVIQLATMASEDPYWQGWASCSTTQSYHVGRATPPGTEHLVARCAFGSPLSIDSLLKLPKGLVEGGLNAFRFLFERLYFHEEERQRRRIANAIAAEELLAAQIGNLERHLKLSEQFRDQPVARLLMERLARNWTWQGVSSVTQTILPFQLAEATVSIEGNDSPLREQSPSTVATLRAPQKHKGAPRERRRRSRNS